MELRADQSFKRGNGGICDGSDNIYIRDELPRRSDYCWITNYTHTCLGYTIRVVHAKLSAVNQKVDIWFDLKLGGATRERGPGLKRFARVLDRIDQRATFQMASRYGAPEVCWLGRNEA